jgi:Txe/YoeB family toxin of Txe-Axe toxin-antitoxin module
MALTKEEKNIEAIKSFLKNNDIDPYTVMGHGNKLETRYYVGDSRRFAEETRIGFNIVGTSDINVIFYEINDIEFETAFKITEQMFSYDEDNETLIITGDTSKKHNEAYKIIISSIYLDLS